MKWRVKLRDGREYTLRLFEKKRAVKEKVVVRSQEDVLELLKQEWPEYAKVIDRAVQIGWLPYTGGDTQGLAVKMLYGMPFRAMTNEERRIYGSK